jgi:hypothetical protein
MEQNTPISTLSITVLSKLFVCPRVQYNRLDNLQMPGYYIVSKNKAIKNTEKAVEDYNAISKLCESAR